MRQQLWKKLLPATLSLAILTVSISALAAATPCDPGGNNGRYCNPLGQNVQDIPTLIQNVLKQLIPITISLAGLGIIIAGFIYVMAAVSGDPGKAKTAKRTFVYVLAGSAAVIGANVIALAIMNFIKNLQ